MKLPRRQFLHLAAGAATLPAVSRIARAQTYPTRPITMNVPYAAGGPLDVMARVVADGLGRALGQTIVIENVAGAGGSLGVGRVARAAGFSRSAAGARPARVGQGPSTDRQVSIPSTDIPCRAPRCQL
jgi:tripartite-type tricarboxylate transporter receptor subunit TctC